jgi:tetratricopeptide (TPR) repeat protein
MSCLLALLIVAQGPANDWPGRRVITKFGTVLKFGKAVVDDEKRSTNLAVSGHDHRSLRVYRVGRQNGRWLWLKAETEGAEGWARVEDVIPFDQAIDYFTSEIRANPRSSAAYNNRGHIWKEKQEYDIAIADYGEAIRLDPKYATAYNARAWLRATCPDARYRDGAGAFADASRAYQLGNGKVAYVIGSMAAAYAECGDFDAAIKWQEKAQDLYDGEEDREKGRGRLVLYRAKTAYRQEPEATSAAEVRP